MKAFIIFLYSSVMLLYIFNNFAALPTLTYVIGFLAFISLITAFFRAGGLYRKSGIFFFTAGIILFFYNGTPIEDFFLQFDTMLGILSLFFVLPFMNTIIRTGHYDSNLRKLLQHGVGDLNSLYKRSFLISHFLGLFLNIATVPLVHNTLRQSLASLKTNLAQKFYSQSILRGYALCLAWSPIEIMVIISLDLTGYTYIYLFPFIVSIVLLMFFSDWFSSKRKYQGIALEMESEAAYSTRKVSVKISQMMGMLTLLVLTATLLEYLFNKGFLFSIVLSIIPISIFWAASIRRIRRYFTIAIPVFKARTLGLSNFFFMFLSAGFFVETLSASEFMYYMEFVFINNTDHILVLYVLIGVYFLVTSFVGFHPLVSIALLGEVLTPVMADITSISLTLVLITSSLATAIYGPYNLSVSLLSNQLGLVPYRISAWNLPFSLYYMTVSILIAYALTFVF
jgi:hypothetical protein